MKKLLPLSPVVFMLFLINPVLMAFDTTDSDTLKKSSTDIHHEIEEGKYIQVSRDDMPKTPAYVDDGSSYFTTQVNITDEGENIEGDAANEPSLVIDPTNPDKMVIGWRQFNTVNNNFRQAGYAYTLDGGDTWTFPGVIEPGVFRSDPVMSADNEGNIYYNSLTSSGGNFSCQVFKMEAGSTEWDEGTFAIGGDKQWMIVDQTDGLGEGHHYAFWTASFSFCFPDQFTRSTDGGESYEDCVTIAGIPRWGTLATDSDGTLYTAGYSDFGYIVSKSSTALNPEWPVSWDSYVEVDLDGSPGFGEGPNPGGLLGQTWIEVDKSDGPHSGNIYVLASVERFSNNDPLDVMFARSTDGGVTWETPKRINQDINVDNWQWFGTMSVSPDGRIDVVWLDTRDSDTDYYSALYYSYSTNGGETFSQNEKISEVFDPYLGWPQQDKMGDYFHMWSDYDYAHLAWANTLNGEQDVYYTRINPWFVGQPEATVDALSVSVFPNPANDQLFARYLTDGPGKVSFSLIDMVGKVVFQDESFVSGSGMHQWGVNTSGLQHGVYCLQVQFNGKRTTKMVAISH